MACRNPQRGEQAQREVRQITGSDAVELMLVDMSLQSSIRAFARAYLVQYDVLDVLPHYLATSPEVSQTTGAYFDDPQHIVSSSAYSRDPENIEQVMALTRSFIREGASSR